MFPLPIGLHDARARSARTGGEIPFLCSCRSRGDAQPCLRWLFGITGGPFSFMGGKIRMVEPITLWWRLPFQIRNAAMVWKGLSCS